MRLVNARPTVVTSAVSARRQTAIGLADRLHGVDAVIDISATGSLSARDATRFFGTVTDNLLAAERAVGIPRHVALSIIGAVTASSGYYAGKALQEQK